MLFPFHLVLFPPQFHCRNGSPYKLQASDNLHICVKHSVSNNIIPHVVEPSAIVGSDVVKISFTTRLSGEYTIDIKLNGTRVRRDGPIKRHYKPGNYCGGESMCKV